MTADEVADEIAKDEIFFMHGGGVTLSGGEVMMQPGFALEILRKTAALGIRATVETSCFAPWSSVEPMLRYLASMFIDVKIMDPQKHMKFTGADNSLILENIRKIDAAGRTKIIIRVPFIPTVNDTEENFELLAGFCKELKNLRAVEILPYHRLGSETYKSLGRALPFPEILPPDRDVMLEKAKLLKNLKCPLRIL